MVEQLLLLSPSGTPVVLVSISLGGPSVGEHRLLMYVSRPDHRRSLAGVL